MLRQWVDIWKKADHALKRVKQNELRNFSFRENRSAIDALMEMGARGGTKRKTSGLVIQQKLFSKLRP